MTVATWGCYGAVKGTKYLGTVEAETEEEAIEKAETELEDELSVGLCHQCSRECESPEIEEITVEREE